MAAIPPPQCRREIMVAEPTAKGDWVASIPVYLSDRERRCLRVIATRGTYEAGDGALDDLDDEIGALEEREFLSASRRGPAGPLVYVVTAIGQQWLSDSRRAAQ
jgi:hypothetical protein